MEQAISPQEGASSPLKKFALTIGVVILIGWAAIMATGLQKVESTQLQGNKAPDFTLPLFDQFEQENINLADLRGQVVVINFWASWCVECYKEAALLEEAWQDYKDQGVMFIGVDHLDTEKDALAYMEKYGITYPSGPDLGDKISQTYSITGVPETFFIDKDGNIVHVQIGPVEREFVYDLLDKLVSQPPKET